MPDVHKCSGEPWNDNGTWGLMESLLPWYAHSSTPVSAGLPDSDVAVCGLQAVADKWASEQAGVAGVGPFKLGFHSIPSMRQLHLHVISQVQFSKLLAVCQKNVTQHAVCWLQDFDSVSLKNKKHWNTFTTAFFLPLHEVVHKLEAGIDNVCLDQHAAQQLVKQPPLCHRCHAEQASIPALKKHIQQCGAPYP